MKTYYVERKMATGQWRPARDGSTDDAVAAYADEARAVAFLERMRSERPNIEWRMVPIDEAED